MPPARPWPVAETSPAPLRRRRLLRTGAAAALALPFLGRSAQAAVTWTLFTQQVAPASAVVRGLQRFSDQVRDRTRGGLLINVRTAGFLPIDASHVLEGVGSGRVELGDDGGYAATVGAGSLMRLPLLATSGEEWNKVAALVRPVLATELERRGMVLLAHYRTAMQVFWSRQKAGGFIDIARQKVRVQSMEQAEFVRHYGGVHVITSTVEAGEALQAGKLDGAFATAAFVARAWRPLLKHAYLGGPNYNDAVIVANQEAMQRLPDGVEAILRATAAEAATWMAAAQDQEEAQLLRQLGGEGLKATQVSREELQDGTTKLPSYWDSWVRLRGPDIENLLVSVRQALDR